jgi:hypothetical protein
VKNKSLLKKLPAALIAVIVIYGDIYGEITQQHTETEPEKIEKLHKTAKDFDLDFYETALGRNFIEISNDPSGKKYYVSNLNPTWKVGAKDAVEIFGLEDKRLLLIESASGKKIGKNKSGKPILTLDQIEWKDEHWNAVDNYLDKIINYLEEYKGRYESSNGISNIICRIKDVKKRGKNFGTPRAQFLAVVSINNINALFHSELLYFYDKKFEEKKRKIFSYNKMCNNCLAVGEPFIDTCNYKIDLKSQPEIKLSKKSHPQIEKPVIRKKKRK